MTTDATAGSKAPLGSKLATPSSQRAMFGFVPVMDLVRAGGAMFADTVQPA